MLNTDRLCMGCMSDKGSEDICINCGFDSRTENGLEQLPLRFTLRDRYIIGKVISSNSEGATYIAWDNSDDSVVNIREYFPAGITQRNPDKTVAVVRGSEFAFNEGLMEFIELHRKLSASELPAILPELSVFEENGTAYSVTRPVSGITLDDFLNRNGGSLKWEQARPLFLPLIDTLRGLAEIGVVHGAISPETILVGRDGKLRLTGFCILAVRSTFGSIAAHIYSGYAAIEQYGGEGANIGEDTDVYGLAATVFRVLIGITPPPADERTENDRMSIPSHFADELPRQVLVALANGLQVDPKKRTATIDSFKNELVYGETAENARMAASRKANESSKGKNKKTNKKGSGAKYALISALCTVVIFVAVAVVLSFTVFKEQFFPSKDQEVVSSSEDTEIPSMDEIGDFDSEAVESKKLYTVPDFMGQYYAKIIENEENDKFEFVIVGKEFSSKYAKGAVCKQSVAAGTGVERDTKIELTISLGPQEIKVPNVIGLDEANAKIELLKAGFLYENIDVAEKYDRDSNPGTVLKQTPDYGTSANTEIVVTIYINSYTGEDEEESSVDNEYDDF